MPDSNEGLPDYQFSMRHLRIAATSTLFIYFIYSLIPCSPILWQIEAGFQKVCGTMWKSIAQERCLLCGHVRLKIA